MTAASRIYLDHNATSPLRPEARAAMIAALDLAGNASSVHAEGRRARAVVEDAREQVAELVGARPEEIVFTSGATEANNWVLRAGWSRLAVGATEHESVLTPARAARTDVVVLGCNSDGAIAFETLAGLFSDPRKGRDEASRGLLSLQVANAETGVVQSIAEAVVAAREHGILVHSDAVQAVGRLPVDFRALGLDLMSVSGHKLGGPKGVGALVIREGIDLPALLAGGGQERRRRAGTENVAAIAGFGAAATAARAGLDDMARVARLRDRLELGVKEVTAHARIVGADGARLPNTSCIAMWGADAATCLIKLDLAGIAVSAGSACSSGKVGGSHVLAAMGIDQRLAAGAIRVSLGPTTTASDIEQFLAAWAAIHRSGVRPRGSDAGRPTYRVPDPVGLAVSTAGE